MLKQKRGGGGLLAGYISTNVTNPGDSAAPASGRSGLTFSAKPLSRKRDA